MSEDTPKVTLSMESYRSLCHDSEVLAALHAAGVDNWEGYSIAIRSMDPDDDDD